MDLKFFNQHKHFFLVFLLFIVLCLMGVSFQALFQPLPEPLIQKKLALPTIQPTQDQPAAAIKPIEQQPITTPLLSHELTTPQQIIVRPGDTLSSIFKRIKLPPQTLQLILKHNRYANALTKIKPGQALVFYIDQKKLQKLMIPYSNIKTLCIESVTKNRYKTYLEEKKTSIEHHLTTATVRGTLYSTAKRQHIPSKLIHEMTNILGREINFAKDVRQGDQFTILYNAHYIENKKVSIGDILAVSYTSKGKNHQAIRHQLSNGEIDYFSPTGNSLKQAFSRYPVQFSHISSIFSLSRMHPILHYRRPHQGVDLAAPIGTPIHATGDGRIDVLEHQGAYGNVIKINHQNSYSTVYAHLHHFAKGLRKGSHVKRGQIIGYVGQSGLADGPHCHFEFRINGLPINPSTVVLPRASAIPRQQMARFKANAKRLLDRMNLFETAHLASQSHTPKKTV